MCRISALICLLLTPPLWAAFQDPVLKSLTPGSITFIGESHKHIESVQLVRNVVADALEHGQCLTLALEIADNEQPAIDRVLNQGNPVSDIVIPDSIDHLPLRGLIKHLATLKTQSPCLNVVAIDAGPHNPHDRDEWMSERLANLAGEKPILVLIGALHTLKKVDWLSKYGKPSVAELLTNKGFLVKSFPQRWIGDPCVTEGNRNPRFVSANTPEALTILNDTLISLINARPHKSAVGVINGFILWECGVDAEHDH